MKVYEVVLERVMRQRATVTVKCRHLEDAEERVMDEPAFFENHGAVETEVISVDEVSPFDRLEDRDDA